MFVSRLIIAKAQRDDNILISDTEEIFKMKIPDGVPGIFSKVNTYEQNCIGL